MPVSSEQKQAIRQLLGDGLDNKQIAAQIGVTPGQVAAVKAHMTMGTYGGVNDAEATEAEVANAVDTAFGLERDLQLVLRRSIDQLEPGLTVIDGDKEQSVDSGRIDITARDQRGSTVVIELKAGEADRDAVGQILGYMGDVMAKADNSEARVRGILVAREFTHRAVSAARAAANVRLVRYGIRFTFDPLAGSTA
jgi:RecB family endonuclease NucS